MPNQPFVPQIYSAGLNREVVGASSVDAPVAILLFEYDGVTVVNPVGPVVRGARILFSTHIGDGTFQSVNSVSNGASDATFTLSGGPNITRAIAVNYNGVAATCTPSTNTVRVVWAAGQKCLLAVW
jgi:hypothetical protein